MSFGTFGLSWLSRLAQEWAINCSHPGTFIPASCSCFPLYPPATATLFGKIINSGSEPESMGMPVLPSWNRSAGEAKDFIFLNFCRNLQCSVYAAGAWVGPGAPCWPSPHRLTVASSLLPLCGLQMMQAMEVIGLNALLDIFSSLILICSSMQAQTFILS